MSPEIVEANESRPHFVIGYMAASIVVALLIIIVTTLALMDKTPRMYRELHSELRQRITYSHYYARDWRWIKQGEHAYGNCAVFAYTAQQELLARGIDAHIKVCRNWDSEAHALAYTDDGYAFDIRFKDVTTLKEANCN